MYKISVLCSTLVLTNLILNIALISYICSFRIVSKLEPRLKNPFRRGNQLWNSHGDLKEGYFSVAMVTINALLDVEIYSQNSLENKHEQDN